MNFRFDRVLVLVVAAFCIFLSFNAQAEPRQAQYASLDYDVVYVRCPRGREPVMWGNRVLNNWNGVNDMWLSASNNTYQQPGCDLVLHHSAPDYNGLPVGDPGREEVLVNCDESDGSQAICSVVDPNVSFDGRYVVYTKFTDTRNFTGSGVFGNGGWGRSGGRHTQSRVELYPDGNGGENYGKRFSGTVPTYDAPALIYIYDLVTKTETQASPPPALFAGRAHPGKHTEWTSTIPVMDTGPFFRPDGRIGFTSNRAHGFYLFQLFAMDRDGSNLELHGHRAMAHQLHPAVLQDGRITYTSFDVMLHKVPNNQYSLFTINPDGSFPFILAGKHEATRSSFHFVTQLSDGDVVFAHYYNHNNGGMGSLSRFPIDPPGPDFEHKNPPDGIWRNGSGGAFLRPGQFNLTPEAGGGDSAQGPYDNATDYWLHPSRSATARTLEINGQDYTVDKQLITMTGRFTHPSGAPDNDLLATYTIGASSTMGGFGGPLQNVLDRIGKDGGIWLVPLEPNSTREVGHIVDDGLIVVDFPEYHEIMARAVVPYERIHGITRPGIDANGTPTPFMKVHANLGDQDPRLPAGSPFGLSGAATLYDRETRALNGVPWNMKDGGGLMSGRTYSNLASSGADLGIYDNGEVYGIRVLLPIPSYPNNYHADIVGESWAGQQRHHLRILGEFPVRKADGSLVDGQGNPDTSFVAKIPADTPFMFQSIDKRGMALDIETASRSIVRGEQQFCGGCHVHTRESLDPFQSTAKLDTAAPYADFSGDSAPLFSGLNTEGDPVVEPAQAIYDENAAPGVTKRRSFAVDWKTGVAQVFADRCASCHGKGQPAQQLTGLRLDGDDRTYSLLVTNRYTNESNVLVHSGSKPGDGLNDVLNETPGTDRITPRQSCCTPSRWLSLNSARSSMLVWALYGERLDGRNPETGLPWGAAGEVVPNTVPKGLLDVPVDNKGLELPEVWPKVSEHAAYVAGMPESEKRLIARWIDIGAPKGNVHDDMIRPVLTLTPVLNGSGVQTVLVGLWDDSQIDYSSFKVLANGADITPQTTAAPDVISVNLGTLVTDSNADSIEFTFEIWDKPDRALSLVRPGEAAANRTRKTVTGRALLRMASAEPNAAPTSASATITTTADTRSEGVLPLVTDPDIGNTHIISVATQPANGSAEVVNNRLVYTPDAGFTGTDSFTFRAVDLGGLSVVGTANITVQAGGGDTTSGGGAGGGNTGGVSVATVSDNESGGGTLTLPELLTGLFLLAWLAGRGRRRLYGLCIYTHD